MVPSPPPLPTRFPCWVRAIYSWGGESKRDVGFIEGDLIECLNAGDGSWWTGRLWRDRRAVGLFPSNFVELLPDTFRPMSRSTSPMAGATTPSPKNTPQKSKTFRKPFEAYSKAPHYTTAKIPETYKDGSPRALERENSRNSFTSVHDGMVNVPSPPQFNGYGSRAPSPAPSYHPQPLQQTRHRQSSPLAIDDESSPPPPRPPPHRHAVSRRGSKASVSRQNSYATSAYGEYRTPRMASPCPPSPGCEGLTPSPVREAMDDVMEQLDALGVGRETMSPDPEPLDPWSPESFDMVHRNSRRNNVRPQTSTGRVYHDAYRQEAQPPPEWRPTNGRDQGPPALERPKSSMGERPPPRRELRQKKSAYEMGRQMLGRTFTAKTNSTSSSSGMRSTTTNNSSATTSTSRSLMSGISAGGISATSAGSLARKNKESPSVMGMGEAELDRPETPFTGVTYHSSHASVVDVRPKSQQSYRHDALGGGLGGLGGLVQPRAKRQNFIKRILESAKTGVASTRGSIATSGAGSVVQSSAFSGPDSVGGRDAARDMGLGSGTVDWVQVRRDVNRSNSLGENEKAERRDRCQMLDCAAINPADELYDTIEGDEGGDGMPVAEPTNYAAINLSQVDKNTRFLARVDATTSAITLATTYVCRPYRSDVQRLRAIFTWVSEKITWEHDFQVVDTRRVMQTKRACSEEYALLVAEMCRAVGLECDVIRGYLKAPGDMAEMGIMPPSNHWWNAVLVDNQWRMMDCSLASPSHPRRAQYSSMGPATADAWWFLARPSEMCWTHIPEHHTHQHLCPPVAHDVLLNLPCACPPFFRHGLAMVDYNTSLTRIEDLEMVHVKFTVPPDMEVAAEVEVGAYARDADGDVFESGDVLRKRALAQAEWFGGVKRYTVKALLPGDEGTGVLNVYVGRRGLMHSIKDVPHPLAFALPVSHTGENPPYEFVTRHPTPHAMRHDIYVVQPQCQRLALNNTFVFAMRQHPSSLPSASDSDPAPMAPMLLDSGSHLVPLVRPTSAMSMTSSSAAASNPSSTAQQAGPTKPAKLAIQSPTGKILRLSRKEDRRAGTASAVGVGLGTKAASGHEVADGGTWETIIKCSEKGVWRGLVLADRTARWCVFAEWICMG